MRIHLFGGYTLTPEDARTLNNGRQGAQLAADYFSHMRDWLRDAKGWQYYDAAWQGTFTGFSDTNWGLLGTRIEVSCTYLCEALNMLT